jgi:hypothetical protein
MCKLFFVVWVNFAWFFDVCFGLGALNSFPSKQHTTTSGLSSFVHFEPVGHSRDHGFNPDNYETHADSLLNIKGGFNHNGGLPPYIVDGSLEAFQWRRENPDKDWEPRWAYEADEEDGTGSNGAHFASHTGNIQLLKHIIENPQHRTQLIHEPDNNGWLPIHEVR